MELELDRDEAKAIILEWAQAKFPGMFDTVVVGTGYHSDFCTLKKSEPGKPE